MVKLNKGLWVLALLASQAYAVNPGQDGVTFGQSQNSLIGNAQNAGALGNTAITSLNQGTNLVQPNGTATTTMEGYGTSGNASGTGLGSFGTSNVTACAGYVIGTGGPARDAECNAVGFASQTTNLNSQANAAYGITGQSGFLQNALTSQSGAAANQANLLPSTVTSLTGTTSCSQQPVAPVSTTQSCYIYNSQSTGGGAITTWAIGSLVTETCVGGANLSTTTCTINPPQGSVSVACLSTQQNTSTGTAQSYSTGASATVTCSGGATSTNNTCTVSPNIQTSSQTMCFSQQQNTSSGTSLDLSPGASVTVNCIAPTNMNNTYCTVTTPLTTQTTSQSCQISVPVQRVCNQIAGANVSLATRQYCVSGNYPVYDGGCAWDGYIPNWTTYPQIGTAVVNCTGQYTFNLTVNVHVGGAYFDYISPNGPWPIAYGVVGATTTNVYSSSVTNTSYLVIGGATVTWDGTSSFFFGISNGSGAWCGNASIPIGTQQYYTMSPTFSDGCSQYGI